MYFPIILSILVAVSSSQIDDHRSANGDILSLIRKIERQVNRLVAQVGNVSIHVRQNEQATAEIVQNMTKNEQATAEIVQNVTTRFTKIEQVMGQMFTRLSDKIDRYHQVSTTRAPVTTTTTMPSSTTPSYTTDTSTTGSTSTTPFTTTPVPWIFYPPGTHDHRVKRDIEGASFVGFGLYGSYDTYVGTRVTSLAACVHYCVSVREHRSVQWNGVTYTWSNGWCVCYLNDVGHHNYNDYLHYKFH